MSRYLDKAGLAHFWNAIKSYVDAHSGGKDFTAELKEKLDGIAKNADVTNDQITQGTVDAYLALGMES